MTGRDLRIEDAADLAGGLRRIDPAHLKPPPPGRTTAWWRGDETYVDVFFESDAAGLLWVEATARGRSLRWDRRDGALRTGATGELEGGTAQPQSKLVVDDHEVDAAVVDFFVAFFAARRGDAPFAEALAAILAAR